MEMVKGSSTLDTAWSACYPQTSTEYAQHIVLVYYFGGVPGSRGQDSDCIY